MQSAGKIEFLKSNFYKYKIRFSLCFFFFYFTELTNNDDELSIGLCFSNFVEIIGRSYLTSLRISKVFEYSVRNLFKFVYNESDEVLV
jgi:hypothetical protein